MTNPAPKEAPMTTTTRTTRTTRPAPEISVRWRCVMGSDVAGWEAVVRATVPTTLTIGLRPTSDEVLAIVERMQELGEVDPASPVIVQAPSPYKMAEWHDSRPGQRR